MSTLDELGAVFEGARRALRVHVVLTMFFAGLCAGSSFLLITIPVGLAFLGAAAAFADGRDLGRDHERTFGAGALAAIGLLPFLGSLAIGAGFLGTMRQSDPTNLPLAIQLGASTLGTMALSPFLAAAHFRASSASTMADALARSIAVASQRPLATLVVGALQGVLFSVPVVAFQLARLPESLVLALVGCGCAWSVYPALGRGLATPSTSAPRSTTWLIGPTVLAWVGMLAVTAAIASPLHEEWPWPPPRDAVHAHEHDANGFVLSTSGRFVRSRRLLIESPASWTDAHGHTIVCAAISYTECLGTELDEQSERIDDDLRGRWRARVSVTDIVLLGGALVVLAWALVRRARAGRTVTGRGTRVMLRFGADAGHAIENGMLVPRGDVRLETPDGDRIVALARALPLVLDESTWRPDAELWLVSGVDLTALGPRVGASGLADDAWLAGGLESVVFARALHVARASAGALTLGLLLVLLAAALPLLQL